MSVSLQRRPTICLSRVYLQERDDGSLVIEEAAQIKTGPNGVKVKTLFGEERTLPGYAIAEINLIENYVILSKKKG